MTQRLDWVRKILKFAVCLARSGNFEMALRIQTRISGDVFIVRCEGRIVFGDEGAALRERVGGMLSGSPRIVVNLKGVHYVDSGGLGILVGLSVSARNRGGELKLVNPSQRVSDLPQRTKLATIIGVYRNDEDAVAAFRKRVA
jgi:anti-sigma B factor antagonist